MDASAQVTTGLFKPVDGGYVFRAPFQLGFGKARHYLVTEDQKSQLAATLAGPRPMLTGVMVVFIAVAIIMASALAVYAVSPHENPQAIDTLAMVILSAVFLIAGYVAWRSYKLRQIAPLVARLTPTDQTITLADIRKTAVASMSIKQLWLLTIVFITAAMVNLAAAGFAFWVGHPNIGSSIAGVGFTALSVYYVVLLVRRSRGAEAK